MARERDAHKKARKGGRGRRRWRSVAILALAVAFLSGTTTYFIPEFFTDSAGPSDYTGPGSGETTVEIPEGASGSEMGTILVKAGVVATPRAFVDAYRKDHRAPTIQPGSYRLKKRISASAAISSLLDGGLRTDRNVTVPVGFTKEQVFNRLAVSFGTTKDQVKAAAANSAAIGLPAEANGNPEGWFLPGSYSFEAGKTPVDAMKAMIDKRVKQLESLNVPRQQWEAVLTKASIVDKEIGSTKNDDYMRKVARIIENRLVDTNEVKKKLQMDSTVLYGLGKTNSGAPSSDEIHKPEKDTPYNTYNHEGLPPSPIGASSDSAIKAVINPADGKWLYFVTVNLTTGETKFAETHDEHNANVEEYKAWSAEHSAQKGSASASSGG